ncbi:MAG: GyrI-like domain-containing protein [Myxococcales bacterium]|nr:GyrI-like domain-containing protein [Myxococcales bacterium]
MSVNRNTGQRKRSARIQTIIGECAEDGDIVGFLETKGREIARKMGDLERIASSIKTVVNIEKEAASMSETQQFEIEEKSLDDVLVASLRWKGRYDESGTYLGKLYKSFGRFASGKPLGIYHDGEYKEEDADIESCVPIRKGRSKGEMVVRKLEGGRSVTLIHKGPYSEIGRTYERLFRYVNDKGIRVHKSSREVYCKGPGMIFKGNPKNYLTEIQLLVEEAIE